MANQAKKKPVPKKNETPWWLKWVNWWAVLGIAVFILIIEPRLLGFVLDRLSESLLLAFGDSIGYLIVLPLTFYVLYRMWKKLTS